MDLEKRRQFVINSDRERMPRGLSRMQAKSDKHLIRQYQLLLYMSMFFMVEAVGLIVFLVLYFS